MKRRDFLQFLGIAGITISISDDILANSSSMLIGTPSLNPSSLDQLELLDGLNYDILIRWRDKINSTQQFGFNNDFIAFHPLSENQGILWVNHEYVHPIFINGDERTKENIDKERREVGGSLIEIKKVGQEWKFIKDSPLNRRIDGFTKIPFAWREKIAGTDFALGSMGNCAGGKTPWGTILTCEENYDMFWGDRDKQGNIISNSSFKWDQFYPLPPEHYGWVVEVEPLTGKSKKLISLGRCAHECAAVTKAKNGKVVAYTGDDSQNEHLYKFISSSEKSLEQGKLYVANLEKGEWISLDINEQSILKQNFKNQTEIQIYLRQAAKLVGATPLARPEDIEFDPLTGHVFVALTNNKSKKNYYGSILKIIEDQNDPGSLKFQHETFLTGSKENGFACPDNMVFDPKGNLWFTSDMAGGDIQQGPYAGLGNNSLFVFMRSGNFKGQILRLANAPVAAEFTGPCFSPDFKTLFLSVQHPGETTTNLKKPTSRWPDGETPKPSVITIKGPLLNKIVQGKL
jgi:hypothetical protein